MSFNSSVAHTSAFSVMSGDRRLPKTITSLPVTPSTPTVVSSTISAIEPSSPTYISILSSSTLVPTSAHSAAESSPDYIIWLGVALGCCLIIICTWLCLMYFFRKQIAQKLGKSVYVYMYLCIMAIDKMNALDHTSSYY